MARAPDAKAEKARELFLSGKKLIEIAEFLDVPEGTVRSWKNRYHWESATLQKNKRNVAKKKGGQPGNKNAVGHGGTGLPGNKNAVTTGEFETLLLIAWIRKNVSWYSWFQRRKRLFCCRKFSY